MGVKKVATKKKVTRARSKIDRSDRALNKLPVHELLALALNDAREQEKHGGLHMSAWFMSADESGIYNIPANQLVTRDQCKTCLGGAVMLNRLPPRVRARTLQEKSSRVPRWAIALDALRRGDVETALRCLERPALQLKMPLDVSIPGYRWQRADWWSEMWKLQKLFKRHETTKKGR
jgi:hypothetical protein